MSPRRWRVSVAIGIASGMATVLSARELTFDERVRAQEAIERVYYAHQIGATKPFEEAVPRAVLEARVRTYLERSVALERLSGMVVTTDRLRKELDRIEARTQLPERLTELFTALGNDPELIEECLVRPALVDRMTSGDSGSAGFPPVRVSAPTPAEACVDDTWSPLSLTSAPFGRSQHTAVWTGNVMIVWGGKTANSTALGDGFRYDPIFDSWQAISQVGAPAARSRHTAVWTGAEMIVWGGLGGAAKLNTGGRYEPISDTWTPTSTGGVPSARYAHTAVWTGTEMIVWGGRADSATACVDTTRRDGGRYDPASDVWTPTPVPSFIAGRELHTAVWAGAEMIVWGGELEAPLGHGQCLINRVGDGARYNPVANSWTPVSNTGAPATRAGHVAAWTGQRMLIWGESASGGAYNPFTDSWQAMSTYGQPAAIYQVEAVWTGSRMIVWGGYLVGDYVNTGGLYDPIGNVWSATTVTDAPTGRYDSSAVWIGDGMLVWGGALPGQALADGGRYAPGNPDNDHDGVCADVDDCPGNANPTQADFDGDGRGDVCENCPGVSNADQSDVDGDGLGDVCDPCPIDAYNDWDGDGVCGNVDNCNGPYNRVQRDTDGDGRGDLCDSCPTVADLTFADYDTDGLGDACDCDPHDPNDRAPNEVQPLTVSRTGTTATLSWAAIGDADAYSVSRGDLAAKGVGQYGTCLGNGLTGTSFNDTAVPAPDQGFSYLVQGQNYDCGMGALGISSSELPRTNTNPSACTGRSVSDAQASGESTVYGTVAGTLADTLTSNDVSVSITEVLSTGGPPSSHYGRLEHRWTFSIPGGSRVELHVEGYRPFPYEEDFKFEYSGGGGSFTAIAMPALPTYADNDIDLIGLLPASASGTVTIRVVDADRTAGEQQLNTVAIDQIWIRTVP